MSRVLASASVLLVAAGSWSVAARQQTVTVAPQTAAQSTIPRLLPGTRATVFGTIQGNALSSTNGLLPDTVVRLRDARYGRIVDTQLTDKSGLFEFKAVEPGSYIVEMMGNDQTLLAASEIINVNAGEAARSNVKLPVRGTPFSRLLGSAGASSAALLAAQAAASGIAAAAPTTPVSPNK
jgi:hypothetical protein